FRPSATFTDDGKYIVTGNSNFPVRIWDLKTRNLVHTIAHTFDDPSNLVRLAPAGGSRFVTAWKTGSVRQMDCAVDRALKRFPSGKLQSLFGLAISEDRRVVGAIDAPYDWAPGTAPEAKVAKLRLWDVRRNAAVGQMDILQPSLAFMSSYNGQGIA